MIEHYLPHSLYELAEWASSNKVEPRDKVIEVWKRKLQTEDDYLVIRFCFVIQQANEQMLRIVQDSNLRDSSKKNYIKAIKSFDKMTSIQSMDGNWISLRNSYASAEVVAYLNGISDAMAQYYPNEQLEQEQLDLLTENLQKIKLEIQDNVDDIFVRNYLIKEFEFLIFCTQHFNFIGSTGLEESAGKILQKCFTANAKIPSITWNKIAGVSMRVLQVVAFVGAVDGGLETIGNGTDWLLEQAEGLKTAELPEVKLLEDKTSNNKTNVTEVLDT